MAKNKKKVDLSKYEHLFDGTYMLLGTILKRLEELISNVEETQADLIRLKKEKKDLEEKLKNQKEELDGKKE